MCFELLKLFPRRQPSLRSPFSFGKKEEGPKLQELTSCYHNGLADSRDGQVPVIIPLYCINTYWKKTSEMAASGSSASIGVILALPSSSHQTFP